MNSCDGGAEGTKTNGQALRRRKTPQAKEIQPDPVSESSISIAIYDLDPRQESSY